MSRGTETCEMCGAEHDKGTWGYVAVLVGVPLVIMLMLVGLLAMETQPQWAIWLALGFCSGVAIANTASDPHI